MKSESKNVKGIIPPIITCFDETGNFNEDAQRRVVSFLNDHVHGYYVCGTYGSGPLLDLDERKKVLEVILDEREESKTVIAHIGTPSPAASVKLGKHAEKVGADAVASVPPFYYTHREEEVKKHFEVLKKELNLPVYFYNNPNTTGFSLDEKFFGELLDEELIDGIKDSSFDIMLFYDLVRKTRNIRESRKKDFTFIVGTEALMVPAMLAGAKGSVAGLANCIPEECVKCFEAIEKGKINEASSLQEKILNERDITHLGPTIPTVHAILKIRGLDAGSPRLPFTEIDEDTRKIVKENLDKLDIGKI